jgi:hypothetical protein
MLKAAAKAVVTMGIATKKDPECVRVVVRSVSLALMLRSFRGATRTNLGQGLLERFCDTSYAG